MPEALTKSTMISVPLVAVMVIITGYLWRQDITSQEKISTLETQVALMQQKLDIAEKLDIAMENQKAIIANQKAISVLTARFDAHCQTGYDMKGGK